MNDSERYLEEFNLIENEFKRILKLEWNKPFSEMLEELSKKDYYLRTNKRLLKNLADLRNTIVHRKGFEYLATPTTTALETITKIRKEIIKPAKLYGLIKNEVFVKSPTTLLWEVLKEIREEGFSQFPVYESDEYIGLISNNSISRWLANNVENDSTIIKDITQTNVLEIIKHNEKYDTVVFLDRNISIKDFVERHLFDSNFESVWLITHSGLKTEKPLSIITSYDVEKILKFYS